MRHAEIAGAGFTGLATSIALAQRGWTVRVHEADHEVRSIGAGIGIWRNGMLVLEALGAGSTARALAHRVPEIETRLNHEIVSRELQGFPHFMITRPRLHRVLLERAQAEGVEIVTDSQVQGGTPEGVLVLEDGTRLDADLIVGADGAGSNVRDSLSLDQERASFPDGVVRLLIRRPDAFRGSEWDRCIDSWTFEPDVMRILYNPCGPDDLYMLFLAETANARASRFPIDPTVWRERFPYFAPLIDLAAEGETGRHDAYQTRKVTPWSSGRVAIVGDAAHAMCPALAQGACTALASSLALAVALDEHQAVPDGLAAWEARERALIDLTQERSAFMAQSRGFSRGNQWNDSVLETARHVPTGTEAIMEQAASDTTGAYDWTKELSQ